MGIIVIVANETLAGADLRTVVDNRIAAGAREFHVVVPVKLALPPTVTDGMAGADVVMIGDHQMPDERVLSTERLEAGLASLRERGCTADGEITLNDAVRTLGEVRERLDVDEVIVSTLPSRISRWLRQDLPTRLCRAVSVPVTVVTPADDRAQR